MTKTTRTLPNCLDLDNRDSACYRSRHRQNCWRRKHLSGASVATDVCNRSGTTCQTGGWQGCYYGTRPCVHDHTAGTDLLRRSEQLRQIFITRTLPLQRLSCLHSGMLVITLSAAFSHCYSRSTSRSGSRASTSLFARQTLKLVHRY